MRSITFHKNKWHNGNYKIIGADENAAWLGLIVFDGARSFDGVYPDLDLHCKRSIKSAELLLMTPNILWEELYDLILDGISKFKNGTHLYIRINFWDSTRMRQKRNNDAEFSITLTDMPLNSNGFSATISKYYLKPNQHYAPIGAKASCLYPNNILASMDAKQQGFDNCVMLDTNGNVAEFTMSNIFYIKNKEIFTPIPNNTFLNGITRQRIIKLLKKNNYKIYEKTINPNELYEADEIFSTGNLNKIQPIIKFENNDLGYGPITKEIYKLYMDFAYS